jgi:hypothetical protein
MTFHKKSAMIFILLLSIVFALGVGCQKTNQGKQTSAQILTIGLDKNVETLDILKTPAINADTGCKLVIILYSQNH